MFLPANITLKFGDSGDFVSELQRRLAAVNSFSPDAVNGFFDGTTVNGVSAFQSMNGLKADGIAGPETLRRLNGVISGDTSSANNHQEDRNRLLQEEAARQIAQQEILVRQQQQEYERLQAEQLAAERAHQQQVFEHNSASPQAETAYAPEVAHATSTAHAAHQQAAEVAHLQMQQQMVQMQHANMQQAMHQPQVEQHHRTHPPQAHVIPVHAPAAAQVITPQPAAAAMHLHPAAVTSQTAEPAAQPKGIVGRAVQYANEMVHKLSAYFESKLPSPVIDEVKDIGKMMAKSGVRETAIPLGPEARGIETPARGPQQQQAQQRG